jgi:hypothetical protein
MSVARAIYPLCGDTAFLETNLGHVSADKVLESLALEELYLT